MDLLNGTDNSLHQGNTVDRMDPSLQNDSSLQPLDDIFNVSTGEEFHFPCVNWRDPQHLFFQLANGCFLFASLVPDTSPGILAMHAVMVIGGLLYSAWAWNVLCAPDIFSWTFGLTFLSFCQFLYDLYRIRPVRLDPEVESVFSTLFQPLGISRMTFKKLVSQEYADIFSLHAGEAYALQNLTRTDRLSLLLSGKAQAISERTTLHTIDANEFLDSPEFQSSGTSNKDKFRVSIVAISSSRYISWQRSSLEYLFVKETALANVFCVLIARDVINKVHAMNKQMVAGKGVYVDLRLTGITNLSNCNTPKKTSPSNTSYDMCTGQIKCVPNGDNGTLLSH